jgi:hypothetical protein
LARTIISKEAGEQFESVEVAKTCKNSFHPEICGTKDGHRHPARVVAVPQRRRLSRHIEDCNVRVTRGSAPEDIIVNGDYQWGLPHNVWCPIVS